MPSENPVPWLHIVKFHQEILKRTELDYFSLQPNSTRSFQPPASFHMQGLADPFKGARQPLPDDSECQLFDELSPPIYFGGPCFLHFGKLVPLFYREIEISHGDFDYLPKVVSGRWNLCPIFLGLLEKKNLTANIDELESDLLARGEEIASNTGRPISDAIARVLDGHFEGLDIRWCPSPWIIFKPPKKLQFGVNLFEDFNQLVKELGGPRDSPGGLALLANKHAKQGSRSELLPFVPLNPKQKEAVQSILSENKITVITGPPGTGKSQVVVSLLLNAWHQGKTVLFASSVHNAVEVVQERLKEFEHELQWVVRAGGGHRENVNEVLDGTSAIVNLKKITPAELAKKQKKIQELSVERDRLFQFIDQREAHRIEELRYKAFDERALHDKILKSLEKEHREYQVNVEGHGLHSGKVSLEWSRLQATENWLNERDSVERTIRADQTDQLNAERDAAALKRERDAIAERMGLDPQIDEIDRMRSEHPDQLQQWLTEAESFCKNHDVSQLSEMDEPGDFARWTDSDQARSWCANAQTFHQHLQATLQQLIPQAGHLNSLEQQDQQLKTQCKDRGLRIDVTSEQVLREIKEAINEEAWHEKQWWDAFPWSRYNRVKTFLRMNLAKIGGQWSDRRENCELVLQLRELRSQLATARETIAATRAHIEGHYRDEATKLELHAVPTDGDHHRWQELLDEVGKLIPLALTAVSYWEHREETERKRQELKGIASRWSMLLPNNVILIAWQQALGQSFVESNKRLIDSQNEANYAAWRREIESGLLQQLISDWQQCAHKNDQYHQQQRRVHDIPTKMQRIQSWIERRPDNALGDWPDSTQWPKLQGLERDLQPIRTFLCEWRAFEQEKRPSEEAQAEKHLENAVSYLDKAVALIPAGVGSRPKLEQILHEIKKEPTHPFPQADIVSAMDSFSVDRIKHQITKLDKRLSDHSNAIAKNAVAKRLSESKDVWGQAVDDLRAANPRDFNTREYAESFRAGLDACPIWVTNGKGTKRIPVSPELFDIVLIDEASQCTFNEILPMVYRAKSLAVVGDENQLEPIWNVTADQATQVATEFGVEGFLSKYGYIENTIFSIAVKSLRNGKADILALQEHYRSHPLIIGFSNKYIYKNLQLKKEMDGSEEEVHAAGIFSDRIVGSAINDTRRFMGEEYPVSGWVNDLEVEQVVERVRLLKEAAGRVGSIGVITPFKLQKFEIKKNLEAKGLAENVQVDTVHGFQGRECDVIVYSCVVANGMDTGRSRWAGNKKVLNVAVTRPRNQLYVVGDFDYIKSHCHGLLKQMIEHCETIDELRNTSPAELVLYGWMTLSGIGDIKVHPRISDMEIDFLLTAEGRKLNVEVDGKKWHDDSRKVLDQARDVAVRSQGISVLRIDAKDVFNAPHDVIHRIKEALEETD